jgi:hypothetical protein
MLLGVRRQEVEHTYMATAGHCYATGARVT